MSTEIDSNVANEPHGSVTAAAPRTATPPHPADEHRGPRRRRRTWLVAGGALVLVVAGDIAYYAVSSRSDHTHSATATRRPVATVTVTRQDLVETQREDGMLGYGSTQTLLNRASGTLTWLPDEGATVGRGHPLYKVDNKPVPLLYGTTPLYRTLADGVDDGPDVREVEDNLHALGYGGFTVDDHYTSATADAVEQFQDDHGLPESGAIAPGDLQVLPGAVRVGGSNAEPGARLAPNTAVYAYTGTTRQATVDLDASDQQLAPTGSQVTVHLPDGRTTPGHVATVGTTAQASGSSDTTGSTGSNGSSSSSSNGSSSTDATITVTVTLDKPNDAGRWDQTPVQVDFTDQEAKNVLTVPITALLALAEGGYGVQVVDGHTSHLVAVKTGLFSDTRVQISGGGLAEGTRVEVAAG